MEEFHPIKNFETYAINKKGEVLDLRSKKLMKQYPNFNAGNYLQVSLINENGYTSKRIHRLVGEAFIPNPSNKPEIDHIDRNRQNNCVDNLRWVDKYEQSENKLRCGKYAKNIILEDVKSKKNPNPSWRISIKNKKLQFSKRFQYATHTYEQIKAIRDDLYIRYDLPILD